MKIVALFTCFNRKEKTENAIRLLVAGNQNIDFFFVITDDNSSDGTPEMLEQLKKEGYVIHYIHGNGSLFYSGGMREAMQYLLNRMPMRYDYVLLMNDDVSFFEKAIEKMIDQSREKEHSVIVGVTCDDRGEYTYGAIKYTRGIHYRGIGIEYSDMICDTFNANCVLIPQEIFVKSGGMDSHYVHGLGDFDFGLQIKRQGAKIYPSQSYVGVCNTNSSNETWEDNTLSRRERIRKKESPKGLPRKIWFYYLHKNFGIVKAVSASITPYIKILIKK